MVVSNVTKKDSPAASKNAYHLMAMTARNLYEQLSSRRYRGLDASNCACYCFCLVAIMICFRGILPAVLQDNEVGRALQW
jgi:hypothetical protein